MRRISFFRAGLTAATIGDIMTRTVVTASPATSLEYVRTLMLRNRISRIVVTNEYLIPVGMITAKDLLRYRLERDSKKLEEVLAIQIMSKPLIRESETTPISSCARRMLESKISSVVVVRNEAIVGIVTKTDLCMFYAMKGERNEEVRKKMTARPITVRASQEILEAAQIMSEKNVSRLPVMNDKLEGIVTASDLTAVNPALTPAATRAKPRDLLTWEKIILPGGTGPRIVGDIMTRNPITTLDTAYLTDVAKLMIFHHISGLPVLDENSQLVGVVTKTDVTKAIAGI